MDAAEHKSGNLARRLFFAVILLGILGIIWGISTDKIPLKFTADEDITGTWETKNGEIMIITETHFIIQGLSFSYELSEKPKPLGSEEQDFVVVVGSLGALRGSYRFEDGFLFMIIDDSEEIFCRR